MIVHIFSKCLQHDFSFEEHNQIFIFIIKEQVRFDTGKLRKHAFITNNYFYFNYFRGEYFLNYIFPLTVLELLLSHVRFCPFL